jgi:hypothetical protein
MTKGIIFNNKIEAEAYNHEIAVSKNCSGETQLWYSMQELTTKTEMSKDEYALAFGIPQTILNEENEEVSNDEYTALPDTIEVSKYAVVVGDDLDETDEEGNIVVPNEVVDIINLIPVVAEE